MNLFDPVYWWWNGVLSHELCDAIISEGDKLVSIDGQIGGGIRNSGQYHPDVRDTNVSFLPEKHWIEGICIHYAMLANKNSGWNMEISDSQNVQYARYFPDQHYKIHRDSTINPQDKIMRKLSVVLQISDPSTYQGGDFIMKPNGVDQIVFSDFKSRGSVLVFPSIMPHSVLPVTKGVRHSIVCWIMGPKFK